MLRAIILGISIGLGAFGAPASAEESRRTEISYSLFEKIWEKAGALEPEKRERLIPVLLETAALTDDPELLESWEARTGTAFQPAEDYSDYAVNKARRFIEQEGWEEFFTRAERRLHPFNFGRPELMAAAAEHLADEQTAARIYALMEELADRDRGEMSFERASFGHALVEAAMGRCDLESFDRALQMTDAPTSIRYAFWRTRMEGEPEGLFAQIDRDFDPESSTLLLRALDGYGDVLRRPQCD